jgi:hypothetical protein
LLGQTGSDSAAIEGQELVADGQAVVERTEAEERVQLKSRQASAVGGARCRGNAEIGAGEERLQLRNDGCKMQIHPAVRVVQRQDDGGTAGVSAFGTQLSVIDASPTSPLEAIARLKAAGQRPPGCGRTARYGCS